MSLKPQKVNFDEKWTDLKRTVKEVITLGNVKRDEWNNRFGDVYSICVAYPEPLADKLYVETKQFLESHVKNLLADLSDNLNENYSQTAVLHKYYKAWKEYSQGLEYLNSLYLYLNQQHIKKQKLSEAEIMYGSLSVDNQEQMEIGELGLDIWRIYMIENLCDTLVKQILHGIEIDRNENSLTSKDVDTIYGVIQSFVLVQDYKKKGSLKLYQTNFEAKVLEASGEYFKAEASKLLQTCSVSEYMKEIIRILEEENIRSHKFLHISSIQKLKKECEDRMITDHKGFLYSECKEMVKMETMSCDKRDDLKNLYILLKPITDGLKDLIQYLLDHIKNEGNETVVSLKGENIHIQFVENMLKVHQKYEELINVTFKNDPLFLSALDRACANVINSRFDGKLPCRSAELVARYCDSLLKKSKSTESEVEGKLSKSITIFKYIEDKDVYQKFYSRMLAKRLIHEQSISMDAEEAMINKLKQACGYEFTNKLHRMYTDITLSAELNNKFNNYLKDHNIEIGINLSIKILQAGAWPLGATQTAVPISVPQEFEKPIQMFETFYSNSYSGRKLTWLHHLCHGELKVCISKKPYFITMQTYQMAMLLLFENCDVMSCQDIKDVLQLNSENFQKHMQSLLESKLLVLCSEKMDDTALVKVNLDFSNKRTKFKITATLQKESPQEVEHTITAVDEDRKLYLQAAIVRIMKSRKILKHNALIQEILSQSKVCFAPSIPMIKKCIESLIDKQYIERTLNSSDEYSYVA